MRLLAETAYPAVVASARVRVVEMGAHLRRHGVEIEFRPSLTDAEYALATGGGSRAAMAGALIRGSLRAARPPQPKSQSTTIVHRLRSLLPGPGDLRSLGVYDFDDAIFVRSAGAHRRGGAFLKLEPERVGHYVRAARLVLAGNHYLADAARGLGAPANQIEVVPSCVDPDAQPTRRHEETERLTLGWIGSATTSEYLSEVLEWLEPLARGGESLTLIAMGARLPSRPSWVKCVPWSIEGERSLLAKIDIGIMPLPDDAWTRGKCGYKILRYGAAGLPTIASPVGVNADLLSGNRGIAASTAADWTRAVHAMRDVSVRREMGAAARAAVEREFSYATWAPRLAQLLRQSIG
jgi:hypothetical protein